MSGFEIEAQHDALDERLSQSTPLINDPIGPTGKRGSRRHDFDGPLEATPDPQTGTRRLRD